ncbi:MAG: 30S ribosomal protein S20 [Desulfosalsimonadaceae bacterium]
MANHKSAIKRIAQSEKKRLRNRIVKTRVKNAVKKVTAAAKTGEDPAGQLIAAQSLIDKAAKKGVIHKRTAARKISRLASGINRLAE